MIQLMTIVMLACLCFSMLSYCKPFGGPPTPFWTLNFGPWTLDLGPWAWTRGLSLRFVGKT